MITVPVARDVLTRALEELDDFWAIALAQVTAVLAYDRGREEWLAVSLGIAVLAVRVVAGLAWPEPGPRRTPRPMPRREREIRAHIAKGRTDQEIARLMRLSERYVKRVRRATGARPPSAPQAPAAPRNWYDHPIVRGTVTAGALLGLLKTLFEIVPRIAGDR